jgi:hypothetical protein
MRHSGVSLFVISLFVIDVLQVRAYNTAQIEYLVRVPFSPDGKAQWRSRCKSGAVPQL